MSNADDLALVARGARWGQLDGQVMFLFIYRWLPPKCLSDWRWFCISIVSIPLWMWTRQ